MREKRNARVASGCAGAAAAGLAASAERPLTPGCSGPTKPSPTI
ncbi:MAG: hypothetical protein R3A44_26575 [Caldilineaceae bacterium]